MSLALVLSGLIYFFASFSADNVVSSAASNIQQISSVLFTNLLLPFEVTSVLILVAILVLMIWKPGS